MTSLWRIDAGSLVPINSSALDAERNLQDWIARDSKMLDQDLLIIGREVDTGHGRIDLLGIKSSGEISIIELKRDRTSRDIIGQVLDYASWVKSQETKDIYEIAERYFRERKGARTLPDAFREAFDQPIPEKLNVTHSMVIVAGELDASSKRIVEYLSEVHGVAINTAFFKVFSDGDHRYLSADWLMEQEVVAERSETRQRAPWTGDWYAIFDEDHSWEDMTKYKFFSAGGGRKYSEPLEKLSKGDPVYVYRRRAGYVGYGIVTGPVVRARDFIVDDQPLFELPLKNPIIIQRNEDNPDLAEYVVPIEWKMTFPVAEAKTFPNIFRNQNIVCKLRDPATLDFLRKEFGEGLSGNQ